MKIIELPNKLLRAKSLLVKLPLTKEDELIAKKLIKYLLDADQEDNILKPGVGIAAVQLGYLKRMFYVRLEISDNQWIEELLINPKITWKSPKKAALQEGEGCLSILSQDDRDGLVHRHYEIKIEGYSYLSKKNVKHHLKGLVAIVFQHEYDHLEGKLYIDYVDYINPHQPLPNEIII